MRIFSRHVDGKILCVSINYQQQYWSRSKLTFLSLFVSSSRLTQCSHREWSQFSCKQWRWIRSHIFISLFFVFEWKRKVIYFIFIEQQSVTMEHGVVSFLVFCAVCTLYFSSLFFQHIYFELSDLSSFCLSERLFIGKFYSWNLIHFGFVEQSTKPFSCFISILIRNSKNEISFIRNKWNYFVFRCF